MPFRPPRNVGLRSRLSAMSMTIQVSIATAVARLVLITAEAASAPAKYAGVAAVLNPFQPSHRNGRPKADGHEQQVVRHRALAVAPQPRPDHRGGGEAGEPRPRGGST